ncbi:MAG: 3-phosphoshikimate 1-carboxyvinyltransferase [Planctomycetota bacterium]
MLDLPARLPIDPLPGPFDVTHRPPGSKSLTNRALLLAALADDQSTIRHALRADDTQVMLDALTKLGFAVEDEGECVRVTGRAGSIPSHAAELDLGNAGTAMRSLAAAVCLDHGTFILDGVPRMRQRPIGELVDALKQLGVGSVAYLSKPGCPPLQIHAAGLTGGKITLKPTLSSQFITALLLAAPCMERGLTIAFEGPVTSQPYVELTIAIMAEFGVTAAPTHDDAGRLMAVSVAPGRYASTDYTVEPDAGSASYFMAAAAAVPGSRIAIDGLGNDSVQGEAAFADALEQMGAIVTKTADATTVAAPPDGKLRPIDLDCDPITDSAMTLAALAAIADGDSAIRNVGNWRVKETDRLNAMCNELNKLGCIAQIRGDDLLITPPFDGELTPSLVKTYDDHRIAMAFGVLGLARPGVTIDDPACVAKTYPQFFNDLDKLRTEQPAST